MVSLKIENHYLIRVNGLKPVDSEVIKYRYIITASIAYNIQVILDRISDGQLGFDAILRDMSHPDTRELSSIVSYGIDQAVRGTRLAPRYHSAKIMKFLDTREILMPPSVEPVVRVYFWLRS